MKIKREKILVILGIVFWVVIIAILLWPKHTNSQPNTKGTDNVCTVNACIKITEQNGTSYNLNDFRFIGNHCIIFISIPDAVHRETCGNYHLTWIGPDNTKGGATQLN